MLSRLKPLLLSAALALGACSGTQSPAVAAAFAQARVILHSAAVGYCALHTIGTPLILLAEGVFPALRILAPTADAFCASVAREETALREAASHVLPAGSEPVVAPAYLLAPGAFAVTR